MVCILISFHIPLKKNPPPNYSPPYPHIASAMPVFKISILTDIEAVPKDDDGRISVESEDDPTKNIFLGEGPSEEDSSGFAVDEEDNSDDEEMEMDLDMLDKVKKFASKSVWLRAGTRADPLPDAEQDTNPDPYQESEPAALKDRRAPKDGRAPKERSAPDGRAPKDRRAPDGRFTGFDKPPSHAKSPSWLRPFLQYAAKRRSRYKREMKKSGHRWKAYQRASLASLVSRFFKDSQEVKSPTALLRACVIFGCFLIGPSSQKGFFMNIVHHLWWSLLDDDSRKANRMDAPGKKNPRSAGTEEVDEEDRVLTVEDIQQLARNDKIICAAITDHKEGLVNFMQKLKKMEQENTDLRQDVKDLRQVVMDLMREVRKGKEDMKRVQDGVAYVSSDVALVMSCESIQREIVPSTTDEEDTGNEEEEKEPEAKVVPSRKRLRFVLPDGDDGTRKDKPNGEGRLRSGVKRRRS